MYMHVLHVPRRQYTTIAVHSPFFIGVGIACSPGGVRAVSSARRRTYLRQEDSQDLSNQVNKYMYLTAAASCTCTCMCIHMYPMCMCIISLLTCLKVRLHTTCTCMCLYMYMHMLQVVANLTHKCVRIASKGLQILFARFHTNTHK